MSRHDKRKINRLKARTCRFQCGRRFDANLRFGTDSRAQACAACTPLLDAAIDAVHGFVVPHPPIIRTRLLIKRIRSRRAEFEAAWRLGADRETLCAILGWNHQEKRLT